MNKGVEGDEEDGLEIEAVYDKDDEQQDIVGSCVHYHNSELEL